MVYGGAGGTSGQGDLACVFVKAGVYAAQTFPFGANLVAVPKFIACKDLGNQGISFTGANGQGGLYFPSSGVSQTPNALGNLVAYTGPEGTLSPPPGQLSGGPAGETMKQACDRIAGDLRAAAQNMDGFDFTEIPPASTGQPWLGQCPRPGGYKGRGGTVQGYYNWLQQDYALRGIATARKDPHFRLAHGDRTDIRGEVC